MSTMFSNPFMSNPASMGIMDYMTNRNDLGQTLEGMAAPAMPSSAPVESSTSISGVSEGAGIAQGTGIMGKFDPGGWSAAPAESFAPPAGFWDQGGTLDNLAAMSNPMMAGVNIPPWLKVLSTVKVQTPNFSVGMQQPSAGKQMAAMMMRRMMPRMFNSQASGRTPTMEELLAGYNPGGGGLGIQSRPMPTTRG